MRTNDIPFKTRVSWYIPVIYLLFVCYGSLIPFDIRPIPLPEAWQRFLETPYLSLGMESRADWIANILLYIPLSFLSLAWLTGRRRTGAVAILLAVSVFAFCASVAVGVEFLQLFAQPRTVSLNDLIAETLGSAAGITLWITAGERLTSFWEEVAAGGVQAVDAALVFCLAGYLALSLFPFDFFVSFEELATKFSSVTFHPVLAVGACGSVARCVISLVVEVSAVAPFGILLGLRSAGSWLPRGAVAAAAGGLLGGVIEAVQFCMVSGVSQGISILTRILGVWLGLILAAQIRRGSISRLLPLARMGAMVAAVPYVVIVIRLNGWLSHGWRGMAEASSRFDKVMLIPFYYHYFTTETAALHSLLANVAMYLPVGAGCFLLNAARGGGPGGAIVAAFLAGVFALVMEAGKLFVEGKHPDFTNGLIAAAAAWGAYRVLAWLFRLFARYESAATAGRGGR